MRFGSLLIACMLACTVFLFKPPQVNADQLTDTEVGQFRALLEEQKLAKEAPAGALSDEEAGAVRGFLDQFKGITFGGFVENFYQYESVDTPAGDNNAISPKVFDRQTQSFTVNNIELWLYKEVPNPGDIGFKITLNWGDQARRLTFVGPVYDDAHNQPIGGVAPIAGQTGGRQATFSEAYVLWNIPIGKGITAKFGKFATWVGYEVWESAWNANFSRSYLYGWGIPFTNTGLGLSYPVTDRFTADYFLTNTSDTFVNNNQSYTHGAQLNYAVPDFLIFKDMNLHFDGLWGPENPRTSTSNGESKWTERYDASIAFSPLEKWTLVTNGNYSQNASGFLQPSGRILSDGNTWGVAQYIIYQHSERIGAAVRGEYFWNEDNMAAMIFRPPGFEGSLDGSTGSAIPGSLVEVTATLNLRVKEKLLLRPEVRYDVIVDTPNGSSDATGSGGSQQWGKYGEDKNMTFSFSTVYEF